MQELLLHAVVSFSLALYFFAVCCCYHIIRRGPLSSPQPYHTRKKKTVLQAVIFFIFLRLLVLVHIFFFFSYSFLVRYVSSGGWGKIKLTTLPRLFIHVVCRFNSIAFAIQRLLAHPSVSVVATARAVPTASPRYYSGSASYRCIRMREYVDPAWSHESVVPTSQPNPDPDPEGKPTTIRAASQRKLENLTKTCPPPEKTYQVPGSTFGTLSIWCYMFSGLQNTFKSCWCIFHVHTSGSPLVLYLVLHMLGGFRTRSRLLNFFFFLVLSRLIPSIVVFALFFYSSFSLPRLTQIRGHQAGSSPPPRLRYAPFFFIAENNSALYSLVDSSWIASLWSGRTPQGKNLRKNDPHRKIHVTARPIARLMYASSSSHQTPRRPNAKTYPVHSDDIHMCVVCCHRTFVLLGIITKYKGDPW